MPPSHRIHAAAGRPGVDGCDALPVFRCWVCAGQADCGILQTKWLGSNFTGQSRVRCPSSLYVCEPCVFVMSGRPPDTLRMQSHFLDDLGWMRWNKGNKGEMRAWLRGPKHGEWFAAIADSGQKHVIPWAPINGALAKEPIVHFEDRLVILRDWRLVDELTELLTAGATKDEIGRGDYGPRAWQLCGGTLRDFEARYRGLRGSGWFDLAVWLAQRDEVRVEQRMTAEKMAKETKSNAERGRKRETAKPDRRRPARDARRVPPSGSLATEALGPTERPTAGGSSDHVDRGGMDDGHESIAAPGGTQRELF